MKQQPNPPTRVFHSTSYKNTVSKTLYFNMRGKIRNESYQCTCLWHKLPSKKGTLRTLRTKTQKWNWPMSGILTGCAINLAMTDLGSQSTWEWPFHAFSAKKEVLNVYVDPRDLKAFTKFTPSHQLQTTKCRPNTHRAAARCLNALQRIEVATMPNRSHESWAGRLWGTHSLANQN